MDKTDVVNFTTNTDSKVPIDLSIISEIKTNNIISNTDVDINRIRYGINNLNNLFKHGTFSIIIKLLVSFMVTLEISNGVSKITIQEILGMIKKKIDELNCIFDELCYTVNHLEKTDDIDTLVHKEKQKFRSNVYKLFDLSKIFHIFIDKCVTMGYGINRLSKPIDEYINQLTVMAVDTILYTETTEEFENTIYKYISERVITIADPSERKIAKMDIIQHVLLKIVNEPVTNSHFITESIVSIELSEK